MNQNPEKIRLSHKHYNNTMAYTRRFYWESLAVVISRIENERLNIDLSEIKVKEDDRIASEIILEEANFDSNTLQSLEDMESVSKVRVKKGDLHIHPNWDQLKEEIK